MNLIDRVLAKIDMDGPDGCWVWTDAPNSAGYGRMNIDGHLFDEANTRTTPRGSRKCRACHRDSERSRRAAEVNIGVPLIAGAS